METSLSTISELSQFFPYVQKQLSKLLKPRFLETHKQLLIAEKTRILLYAYDVDEDEYNYVRTVYELGTECFPYSLEFGFALSCDKQGKVLVYDLSRHKAKKGEEEFEAFSYSQEVFTPLVVSPGKDSSFRKVERKDFIFSDQGNDTAITDPKTGEELFSFPGKGSTQIEGTNLFIVDLDKIYALEKGELVFVEKLPRNVGFGIQINQNTVAFTTFTNSIVIAQFPGYKQLQELAGDFLITLSPSAILVSNEEKNKSSVYVLTGTTPSLPWIKWNRRQVFPSHSIADFGMGIIVIWDQEGEIPGKAMRWDSSTETLETVYTGQFEIEDKMLSSHILAHDTKEVSDEETIVFVDIMTGEKLQSLGDDYNYFVVISPHPQEYIQLAGVISIFAGNKIPKELAGVISRFL